MDEKEKTNPEVDRYAKQMESWFQKESDRINDLKMCVDEFRIELEFYDTISSKTAQRMKSAVDRLANAEREFEKEMADFEKYMEDAQC